MTIEQGGGNGEGKKEFQPEIHDDLVAKYRFIQERTGMEPHVIYHPCGAYDVSPSAAFPRADVVYADQDKKAVHTLQHMGYDAHDVDATEFTPNSFDTLILLNPHISPEIPAARLATGGYAIANNYHESADWFRDNTAYELVGVVRTQGTTINFDTEQLGDYWKEIETDDEFKISQGDLFAGRPSYDSVVHELERMKHEESTLSDLSGGVLSQYKELIKRIKDGKVSGRWHIDDEMGVLLRIDDQRLVMMNFPRKKGTVDDLYVFRKKS